MRNSIIAFLCILNGLCQAQDCNKLGVWLWHIETTGFTTHQEIAERISSLGIKRIYVKVADGAVNPISWPELIDTSLVSAYHLKDVEVWAWSYNYTSDPIAQANALYEAAKSGYDGYVVDVEMQFDGKPAQAQSLFEAFYNAREDAILDGIIVDTFPIYCTTWGNPADHNFPISSIDPYVDGFMPQTYVEVWGTTYLNNITYWIEVGNDEYRSLGATKDIHHIAAMEKGIMTDVQVNEFITASGPQTSVWRIPGGGTPLSIWDQWELVDWNYDFCEMTDTNEPKPYTFNIYPNPASQNIHIYSDYDTEYIIIDNVGRKVASGYSDMDISHLPSGIYFVFPTAKKSEPKKLIIIQ